MADVNADNGADAEQDNARLLKTIKLVKQVVFVAGVAFAPIGAIAAFFWYFAEDEMNAFIRTRVLIALSGDQSSPYEHVDGIDATENFLPQMRPETNEDFRKKILVALAGDQATYEATLAALSERETEVLENGNILKHVVDPPSVEELRSKIDGVYIYQFSRFTKDKVGPDGRTIFNEETDVPEVDVIENNFALVHAQVNQELCVSFSWIEISSDLQRLLQEGKAVAVAEIGEEKRTFDNHGLNPSLISEPVHQELRKNPRKLFRISIKIDADQNVELPPSHQYKLSAIVTAYKGKPNDDVCV